MTNIFQYLPDTFFRPLASKNKETYVDCILIIFELLKSELSFGVNKEIIVSRLENHFSYNEAELFFEDDDSSPSTPREKALSIIRVLKNSGWLDYENIENHQTNIVLYEYAVPIIESFNTIMRNDETEYQGLFSQIHASLQNRELYSAPYELILKGAKENTDRLISELKKLNASIKRYIDKQTSDMQPGEIIELLFDYQQTIGSKAYFRMKTSDNVARFRNAIVEKLQEFIENETLMQASVKGCMEIEGITDTDSAKDLVYQLIYDIKSAFYALDDIIKEIDRKNTKYIKNAIMRAKFLLSSGNNIQEKINFILKNISEQCNSDDEKGNNDESDFDLLSIFNVFPQRFIDNESLRTIPVERDLSQIESFSENSVLTEQERQLYIEALQEKNRGRFSRKNIDEFVKKILVDKDIVKASTLPLETKRDVIRLIYISIYAGNKLNCYTVKRKNLKICTPIVSFYDFDIIKVKGNSHV